MASGFQEPLVPSYPTACTIASPGAVDTDVRTLGLPWFGLGPMAHDVPFHVGVPLGRAGGGPRRGAPPGTGVAQRGTAGLPCKSAGRDEQRCGRLRP